MRGNGMFALAADGSPKSANSSLGVAAVASPLAARAVDPARVALAMLDHSVGLRAGEGLGS